MKNTQVSRRIRAARTRSRSGLPLMVLTHSSILGSTSLAMLRAARKQTRMMMSW